MRSVPIGKYIIITSALIILTFLIIPFGAEAFLTTLFILPILIFILTIYYNIKEFNKSFLNVIYSNIPYLLFLLYAILIFPFVSIGSMGIEQEWATFTILELSFLLLIVSFIINLIIYFILLHKSHS